MRYHSSVNEIERILKERILDKNSVFIFNSDVAANSWSDFIVRQDGKDGWPKSVELDRFLAWDVFKGKALKIEREGMEAIPSLLRKLFARSLLKRVKDGERIFERLINFDYRENALSFTDWLSSLLPSLGRWRILARKIMDPKKDGAFLPERDNPENRDCLRLYNEYSKFLEERGLFEPSWQKAVFDGGGEKKYVIFFPELLDDFDEYKEVLEDARKKGSVYLANIPKSSAPTKADYWTSVRLELRMAALKILRENASGVDWNDIALCVPDIENLRPYVERELALYQIPFVTRAGIKLGAAGAGKIFRKIQDCAAKQFSYQSVRALVLDSNFPWKNPDEMETLVRLGKESKCLAQFTGSDGRLVDPWLLDLSEGAKKDSAEDEFLDTKKFYKSLKAAVLRITDAKTFLAIKDGWKKFEGAFIKPQEEIKKEANDLLSRCVALMDQLAALEEKFPDVAAEQSDKYAFFLNELENTVYQKQSKSRGVSIYDYKVSAEAAIKRQFVINASQDKITVEKISLPFLSQLERGVLLGQENNDHSESYVRSYELCSNCAFSASQNALDGFAIPHSALETSEDPSGADEELDKADFIKIEKDFLHGNGNEPKHLSGAQKESLESYLRTNESAGGLDSIKENQEEKPFLLAAIEKKTMAGRARNESDAGETHITPSDLKDFFPCPRKWIFKDLLRVNEFSLDTDLFEIYDQGSVNHKILEIYFNDLKERNVCLPAYSELSGKLELGGDKEYEEKKLSPFLEEKAKEAFAEAKAYKKSVLVQEALKSQTKNFSQALIKFLREFCREENFGGWKVQETEWGTKNDVRLPPILQGRMDLVLRSPRNQVAILDYKNTKSAIPNGDLTLKKRETNSDGSPKELDNCQIAAYVFLWENANPAGEDMVQKASFVSINKYEETKVIYENPRANSNAVPREDFSPAIESLKRRLAFMGQALKECRFSLKETRPYKDCVKCDYKRLCRTTY